MVTIIIFIAVLAVLVLVHEFGHFIAARKNKVLVEEFGIGFPPRIFSWKKGETRYSLNSIPLGGFVKLKGEQGESLQDEDSFAHKPKLRRAIILVSGVGMNILLAIVLFSILFSVGTPTVISEKLPKYAKVKNERIQVIDIADNSPAKEAGIKVGESIVSVNGSIPKSAEQVKELIIASPENTVLVIADSSNNKQTRQITLVPRTLTPEASEPAIGVYTNKVGDMSFIFPYSIVIALREATQMIWLILSSLWTILSNLVVGGSVPSDVVGPVGIAVITGKIADLGFRYFLQFIALISLNLAIINILPIPALDGGRLLFLIIESIRKKPVSAKIEALIHNIGFVVLIGLIALITVRDIIHIDYIKSLF